MSDEITEDYVRGLEAGDELNRLCARFMEDPIQWTLIDQDGREPWGVKNVLKGMSEKERRWWLKSHQDAGKYLGCRFEKAVRNYSGSPKLSLRLLKALRGTLWALDGSCGVKYLGGPNGDDLVELSASGVTLEHSIALCAGILVALGVTKNEMAW